MFEFNISDAKFIKFFEFNVRDIKFKKINKFSIKVSNTLNLIFTISFSYEFNIKGIKFKPFILNLWKIKSEVLNFINLTFSNF